jgi:hypothetical protein
VNFSWSQNIIDKVQEKQLKVSRTYIERARQFRKRKENECSDMNRKIMTY